MVFFLISSMVLGLFNQLQIFWQLYLIIVCVDVSPHTRPLNNTTFLFFAKPSLNIQTAQALPPPPFQAFSFYILVFCDASPFWRSDFSVNPYNVKILNWLLNLNLIYETLEYGRKWLFDFNAWKTQLVLFGRSNNTDVIIDVRMDWSILEKKSSFKMPGLIFSSNLDRGCYIISIPRTTSKKIVALIHSMKFLFPETALYLCKSSIHPCMQYFCHVWAGAPGCFLELLDQVQKLICRTVGSSLATSLEPWPDRQNVASLSLFYRSYFSRCSSELA